MSPKVFIHSMTGRIFKTIPLHDEPYTDEAAENLQSYMHSLVGELMGACETFPFLGEDAVYLSVINTMQFLTQEPQPFKEHRREVLKVLRLMNDLEQKVGDANV